MKISKTKTRILSAAVVVLSSGVFWIDVNRAQAVGAANFPDDTTVTMTVADFTIVGPSDADEVITTATTVTVTISDGQSFTLKSADRKLLNVNGDFTSKTCTTTESTVKIAPASGDSQRTVVITPQSDTCTDTSAPSGSSSSGGGGGGGATTPTATPTPTPTQSPDAEATPTPTPASSVSKPTPASRGFVNLESVSLNDGDVISAVGSDDPDVYIVNPHGYKRLFLNPAIFSFYGHLGGFQAVKATTNITRDMFVTSGLFRNCETDDPKVYGVEVTGEDVGMLHWVNTTGEQAVADDPDFFKKVFCINTAEFNWYPQGADYASVNQIPDYARGALSASSSTPASSVSKQYKVVSTVGYLNMRASATTASAILGQLSAGDTVISLSQDGVWHKIMLEGQDAWVHGDYLE